MATLEEIFNSTRLDVIVSEVVRDLPDGFDFDDWQQNVASSHQRDKAFFDERLLLFFTVKAPHPGTEPVNRTVPPLELALFLTHLQVTLDAKYIAPQSTYSNNRLASARGFSLAPPPRSHSHQKAALASPGAHPSIFPPHTPHPTPQAGDADRKYANPSFNTEGTVLESYVWGGNPREEPTEKNFALLWSTNENAWVAIYRLTVGVSFVRTSVPEPLLSLTVSATLRDKPLTVTPERQAIFSLVQAAGGLLDTVDQTTAAITNGINDLEASDDELRGLEEVNLLEGLSQDPTLGSSGPKSLSFPSTRLGATLRQSAYWLPPVQPTSPKLSTPLSASSAANTFRSSAPILRKSYLKTLQTVSGFQIRMKSVFVPYVVIPGSIEDERERHEAGSEERTVVLSVELGNGGSYGNHGSTGFAVEGIDVSIGGEGANANLIGWGENGFQRSNAVFPLLIGPFEQFNMLYAVTFLRQSEADDIADTLRNEANGEKLPSPGGGDMQRPVTIVIRGRPYDLPSGDRTASDDAESLTYPTQTFRSRWNCVLDLSSAGHSEVYDVSTDPPSTQDALPAPATPFPAASPQIMRFSPDKLATISSPGPTHAVAGSKRHTIGGLSERHQRLLSAKPHRNSTSILHVSNTNESPISVTPKSLFPTGGGSTPMLPTAGVTASSRSAYSAAMSGMLSPTLDPRTPGAEFPPPTPAYPAYPTEALPQTPAAQSPISNLRATVGYAIEPRREHATQAGTPQTPGPHVPGLPITDGTVLRDAENGNHPVVVSVGLIPPRDSASPNFDLIYVLDTFGVEIFVFNRSERTRRFEVSHPDKKRRRQQAMAVEAYSTGDTRKILGQREAPGILPLENRIRVGPLRPHTCQSVRMQFLALRPGVHSIHSLTLMDVETGYLMNLKSVTDVVIHDPNET